MAEGFLAERSSRLLGRAVRVRSAGTHARPGSPPTVDAIRAAAERGVDISPLEAARLDSAVISGADLVLTMTAEHRDAVIDLVPEAAVKTFTLKELVVLLGALPASTEPPTRESLLQRIAAAQRLRTGPQAPPLADIDVSDPLGLSTETYRAVAWEVEGQVDALVAGLFGWTRSGAGAPAGERRA